MVEELLEKIAEMRSHQDKTKELVEELASAGKCRSLSPIQLVVLYPWEEGARPRWGTTCR